MHTFFVVLFAVFILVLTLAYCALCGSRLRGHSLRFGRRFSGGCLFLLHTRCLRCHFVLAPERPKDARGQVLPRQHAVIHSAPRVGVLLHVRRELEVPVVR